MCLKGGRNIEKTKMIVFIFSLILILSSIFVFYFKSSTKETHSIRYEPKIAQKEIQKGDIYKLYLESPAV